LFVADKVMLCNDDSAVHTHFETFLCCVWVVVWRGDCLKVFLEQCGVFCGALQGGNKYQTGINNFWEEKEENRHETI
jgi:hypothetical protein